MNHKHYYFVISLLLTFLISHSATGQYEPRTGIQIYGGYSIPTFKKATNLTGGLGYRYERMINETLDLRIGGKLDVSGSKLGVHQSNQQQCSNCYNADYKEYNFLYLQFPVNLRYNITSGENHTFYAAGGLTPSIILKDRLKYNSPEPKEDEIHYTEPGESEFTEYFIGSVHSLQWLNFNFAGGTEFELDGNTYLQLELQLYYNTMNVIKLNDELLTGGLGVALLWK